MRLLLYVSALLFSLFVLGEDQRPNVVLIVVDTLRYDHVGCNGYKRDTTPNIDRLAREGARLEQMVASSSWTIPSLMSLFTSLPPSLHQVTSYQNRLPDGLTTLAAELKNAGYDTFGVVSNPSATSKFGFDAGFKVYDDFTIPMSVEMNLFQEFEKPKSVRDAVTSAHVNRIALQWLETKRDKSKPFFQFLLYIDPHGNYMPPAPYDKMFSTDYKGTVTGRLYEERTKDLSKEEKEQFKALYDGEIRNVDDHIGRILEALTKLKLDENTIVIVTSDHGEEFWDHDGTFHGHTVYDELVRVPFVVRWPKKIKAGLVLSTQVSQMAVMPTVLEAIGAKAPKQCHGVSILEGLLGNRIPEQKVLLEADTSGWGEGRNLKALRYRNCKVILDVKSGQRTAFDLTNDPGESKPLKNAAEYEAVSKELDEYLKILGKLTGEAKAARQAEVDEKLLEHLKQMGYAQ